MLEIWQKGKIMERIVSKKCLLIEIPERIVREQYGWLSERGNTREGCVRAYILKHPEMIKEGLTIANLLAVNVWLNKWKEGHAQDLREVDLVFEKEGIYYLVETKRDRKYTSGYRQLSHIMECFHSDFEKNKVTYNDFIPVLVTTSDKVDRIETTWVQPDFSAFLAEE
jgi:hypothetical protein